MTIKETQQMLAKMNDRHLARLIAMANYEERSRLGAAHRQAVRRDGGCLVNHVECRQMLDS